MIALAIAYFGFCVIFVCGVGLGCWWLGLFTETAEEYFSTHPDATSFTDSSGITHANRHNIAARAKVSMRKCGSCGRECPDNEFCACPRGEAAFLG